MQVNPYQEDPERRNLRRQVAAAVGVVLVLGGSYVAIVEAFGDHTVCSAALGCLDARNPEDIWLGLVLVVVGGLLVWRNWRRPTG